MQIYISKAGQQYGPYTVEQLRVYVQQGNFTTADLACCDGQNWVTVAQVPGLMSGSQQPTPVPPSSELPTRHKKKRTRKRVVEPLSKQGRPPLGADLIEAGERQLYKANPAMFRNSPICFIISIILILAGGLGLVILLFWWLNVKGMTFMVSNERVTLRKGILSKHTNEIFLNDIRNVQISQSFFQRIFGVATIGISSAGQAGVEIICAGLRNPNKVKDIIDRHRRG
jgi:membrane protein YdbS with pleckstrin-like domain